MWGNNPKSSSSQQTEDGIGPESALMTVGRYLKSQREARGEEVAEVADMLRIHRGYLQAIEDNEIDKLPGPTYAVGFVRAYAEHLGLDGATVAERFKDEGKVQEKRAQLVFPTPLPEGQIPSGPILLAAAAFLAVAYGGWVFVSSPNDRIGDMVPSLPDKIASFLADDETVKPKVESATEKQAVAPAIKTESAPTSEPEAKVAALSKAEAPKAVGSEQTMSTTSTESETPRTGVSTEVEKSAEPVNSGDKTSASVEPTNPERVESTTEAPSAETAEKPVAPTVNDSKLESDASTEVTNPKTEKPVGSDKVDDLNFTVAKTADGVQTAAVAPAQTEAIAIRESESSGSSPAPLPRLDDAPRVFGEADEGSRIKIEVLVDSWVEVRAGDGELLLTRVLRKGDSYHVPNRTGLTLMTGNAGGLKFSVDGKVVPEIGPLGTVRRNVKLDPKALTDGTANDR